MVVEYPRVDSLWDALTATWGQSGSYAEAIEDIYARALKEMTPVTLNQDTPVQNTWYEVLGTTTLIVLDYIVMRHTDNDARNLSFRVTADGREIVGSVDALAEETDYFGYRIPGWAGTTPGNLSATQYMVDMYKGLPALSAKVEVRTTDTFDAGEDLLAAVFYHRREAP